MLRMALPPYRLPRDVLDREVERLIEAGIRFVPNHRLGREMSLEELSGDFGAVFLAPGTERGRTWNVDGVVPHDLRTGLDLLMEWLSIGSLPSFKRVAIIGGGNTAIDLARVLRFTGVPNVHVITFQALPGQGVAAQEAMSGTRREIEQALEEGVIIHDHRGVRRLIIRGERAVGVEMVHMKELPRGNGRREAVAFEGTETVLEVDQVIPAIGQQVDPRGMETLLGHGEFFTSDSWDALGGHPGLFVGGDATGRCGTVSACGRRRPQGRASDRWFPARSLAYRDPAGKANRPGSAQHQLLRARPTRSTGDFAARGAQFGNRNRERPQPGAGVRREPSMFLVRRMHGLRQLLDAVPGQFGAEDARPL